MEKAGHGHEVWVERFGRLLQVGGLGILHCVQDDGKSRQGHDYSKDLQRHDLGKNLQRQEVTQELASAMIALGDDSLRLTARGAGGANC